jgi:RecJ-like exonuclease
MSALAAIDILQRYFCADSQEPRWWMRTPHIVGGRVCATNGHWIGVLDPSTVPSDLATEDSKYERIRLVDTVDHYAGTFIAASAIGIRTSKCPDCKGAGRASEATCEDCEGKGEFWHGSHEYECKECEGTGNMVLVGAGESCSTCQGAGRVPEYAPSTHGDAAANLSASCIYIAALRALGGEISAEVVDTGNGNVAWLLRFPGGRGLLSPMSGQPMPAAVCDLDTSAVGATGGAA